MDATQSRFRELLDTQVPRIVEASPAVTEQFRETLEGYKQETTGLRAKNLELERTLGYREREIANLKRLIPDFDRYACPHPARGVSGRCAVCGDRGWRIPPTEPG